MREDLLLKIKPLFEEHLGRTGYCLVDLRFYKNQLGALILEVLADRTEGGITLDECTVLNRELGGLLEKNGLEETRYTLDVSSPGLDRPLFVRADFRRVIGREIRVFLKEEVEGKIEHAGALVSAGDDGIELETTQKTIVIPYDKVNRAKQVIL